MFFFQAFKQTAKFFVVDVTRFLQGKSPRAERFYGLKRDIHADPTLKAQ
jgi:hypothetical protein